GRADLAGMSLRFNNQSFAVVGVLPPEMEFPPNTAVWFRADNVPPNTSRTAHNWRVAGRIKPGISMEHARSDIAGIVHQLKSEHGSLIDAASLGLTPLRERFV